MNKLRICMAPIGSLAFSPASLVAVDVPHSSSEPHLGGAFEKPMRRSKVRELTDRRTGRTTYRYVGREMSGQLPAVLYKYLPFQYSIPMVERGELMFSTLTWFQNLEDRERGDEFEGTRKYFPIGGLELTRIAQDGKPHLPVAFTRSNDSLQSKAKGSDHIFIYSTARVADLTQFADATGSSACVEIHNPSQFLLRLRTALRRTPTAKAATLIHDEVRYYSFENPPENVHALPDRLTMHKQKDYQDQHEYRFAFGTKRDVFDFGQIDYLLVPERIQRRKQIPDQSDHRWKLTIGSLTDCCRLV